MTTAEIEGWVLDYACKFNHHEVIAALHHRYGDKLSTICEVDVRLSAATLHRIVHCRELDDFNTAVELVEDVYSVISDHCPPRVYYRLVFPLKIMVLLDELKKPIRSGPSLNLKLNEYIPRCGIISSTAQNKHMERLQKYLSNFRKFYLSLLSNESQRRAYIEEELENDFGEGFKKSLERLTSRFLEEIEKCLPLTVIEKMLEKGTRTICENVPYISAPMDILLECLCNKKRLDTTDLLDLLTLIHPISTQDRVQHKLHLTFGFDDSSNDSRLSEMSISPAIEQRSHFDGNGSKISLIHLGEGSSMKMSSVKGTEREIRHSSNISQFQRTVESSGKISPIQRAESSSGNSSPIQSSERSCSKISPCQKTEGNGGKITPIQRTTRSSSKISPSQKTEGNSSKIYPIVRTEGSSHKSSSIQRTEGSGVTTSTLKKTDDSISTISLRNEVSRSKSSWMQNTDVVENPTQMDSGQTSRQSSDVELSPSGESVSIFSRRPPARTISLNRKTETSRVTSNDPLSQVYVISSSSDSATTQGSQGQGQGHEEQVCEINRSESTRGSHCDSSNDTKEDNLMCVDNSGELESSGDISNSFGLIPSSINEEMRQPELDASQSPVHVEYPSIQEHQKATNIRLCVIKLYRDKDIDMEVNHTHMELYR